MGKREQRPHPLLLQAHLDFVVAEPGGIQRLSKDRKRQMLLGSSRENRARFLEPAGWSKTTEGARTIPYPTSSRVLHWDKRDTMCPFLLG